MGRSERTRRKRKTKGEVEKRSKRRMAMVKGKSCEEGVESKY